MKYEAMWRYETRRCYDLRGYIRIEVIFESYMIWDMKYDNLGLDYDIICIVRDVMSWCDVTDDTVWWFVTFSDIWVYVIAIDYH